MNSNARGAEPFKITEPPYSLKEDDVMLGMIANTPGIFNQFHADYKNYSLKEEEWAKIADKVGRPTLSCKKRWRTIRDNYYKQKKFAKTTGRPYGRKYPLANKLKFLEYKKTLNPSYANSISQDASEGSDNFEDLDEASSNFLEIVREDEIKQEAMDQHMKYTNSDDFKIVEPNNSIPSFKILEPEESFDPLLASHANKNNFLNQVTKLVEKRNNEFDILMKYITELTKIKELDDIDLFFKSMAMTVKTFTQENIARVKLKVCQVVMEIELENQ